MGKHDERTLKIGEELRKILREEYTDEEGNWEAGANCEPFFISSLLAITMLYNEITRSGIDSLQMTYKLNRLMVKAAMEKMGVNEIRV